MLVCEEGQYPAKGPICIVNLNAYLDRTISIYLYEHAKSQYEQELFTAKLHHWISRILLCDQQRILRFEREIRQLVLLHPKRSRQDTPGHHHTCLTEAHILWHRLIEEDQEVNLFLSNDLDLVRVRCWDEVDVAGVKRESVDRSIRIHD